MMLKFWILLTLFVSLMFFGIVNARPSNCPDANVCTSPSCVMTSAEILGNMNMSVNPCDDMYQYACGKWVESASIPAGHSQTSRAGQAKGRNNAAMKKLISSNATTLGGKESSAIKKLKTLYNTCMDEQAIEKKGTSEILQLISRLGSWTVTSAGIKPWNRTTWTLQRSLEKMQKVSNPYLFAFQVMPDFKNTKKNLLAFVQTGLTLPTRDQYLGREARKVYKDAFLTFATKIAVLLGGKEEEARPKMEQVFDFEAKLAKIFVPPEKMVNPKDTYNKMSIRRFQKMLGNWINVRRFLKSRYRGRQTFTKRDKINVYTPNYFEKVGPIIEKTDSEVLANYMMWHLVTSFIDYLPAAFSEAYLEFSSKWTGVTSRAPRWQTCLATARSVLGYATSALYVEENFSAESKSRVETILREIKEAFVDNLASVTWLDDVTRSKLKEKAEAMEIMVGYPDWIMDVDKLDERYAKLTVKPGEYVDNIISAIRSETDRALDEYNKPPDRRKWHQMPDEVNAYHAPSANIIGVPAGFLIPPFFAPDYPDAYIYGTMGAIAGHELTHGFDSQGRHHDKYGNLVDDLWTKEAEKEYVSRTKCMVEQYNNYSLFGHQINGPLTVGENIADNGGLKLAYQAFKKKKTKPSNLPGLGVTDEQLFFLGFSQCWCVKLTERAALHEIRTDVHANGQFRVTGPVSNSDYFAQAFQCPSGAPLNPREKCRIW